MWIEKSILKSFIFISLKAPIIESPQKAQSE